MEIKKRKAGQGTSTAHQSVLEEVDGEKTPGGSVVKIKRKSLDI